MVDRQRINGPLGFGASERAAVLEQGQEGRQPGILLTIEDREGGRGRHTTRRAHQGEVALATEPRLSQQFAERLDDAMS